MIDWPSDVRTPDPHVVFYTAFRRTRNRAMATGVMAIYVREVIERDREGRNGIWLDACRQMNMKTKTLERAVARRQNCPDARYLSFGILNELISRYR